MILANLGPADLTIVFIIALLVFGPKRLPEVGRQVGLAMKEVRKLSNEFLGSMTGMRDDVHDVARSLNPFAEPERKQLRTYDAQPPGVREDIQPPSSAAPKRRGLTISTLPSDETAPEEETK